MSDTTMIQSELSENLDAPTLYYCGLRASNIGACLYKIYDDSVRPRNFLGTDSEYGIEAILSDHEGHSLHEFIGSDKPLRPIIDFDLPIETLNAITPKVSYKEACKAIQIAFRDVCLEIHLELKNIAQVTVFTKLVRKKLQVGLQKKIIIDNIANKRSFSLRMLGSSKYKEETKEHIRVKKAIHPKDETIFDFMIRLSNDESEVIESPLLDVSENISRRKCSIMSNITTEAKFKLAETLLKETNIEGYNLSFLSENFSDKFLLSCISSSYCPLCDQEHTKKQPGTKNPSLKLTISETALDREKKLPSKKFSRMVVYEAIQATIACVQKKMKTWILKHRNLNGELMFDIGPKLDIANFTINIIELGGMASGEWHKANDHLKALITENYVSIERKGLESQDCNHFAGFMILSNHDAPIRVKMRDGRIICLNVSPCYKNNFAYFDQLGGILEHSDTPRSFMSYLLSFNLSGWKLYKVAKLSSNILYQEYFDWCGGNGEKLFSNNILDDIEEFSDTPQPDLPENETTDIPIFNVPEFIPPKIILPQTEKNLSPSNKKADKQKNLTQALSELKIDQLETSKLPEPIELISGVVPDMPFKETDSFKPINKVSSAILLSRAQREERLRKRAIKLSEDPDKFMTITEKDRLNSIAFHYKMEMDAQMCDYAKESEEDPNENMEMTGMTKKYKHTSEEWYALVKINFETLTIFPCGHAYHRKCIEKNFLLTEENKCPIPDCDKIVDSVISKRRFSESFQSSGTSAIADMLGNNLGLNSPMNVSPLLGSEIPKKHVGESIDKSSSKKAKKQVSKEDSSIFKKLIEELT
ncbi:365_t:CDS:10 [Cetraspora pellucida]|uniref:365_t:CDS:1 n=1 Tax=Cetraspora pellucida TaxID=1433469 RepID=A0A9N9JAN1_9GLOM|nr:365_t:CDS:10 [Cetraspora pellucida]